MRIYNGFVVEGQLTADQKRTLSMTKRSLINKGIRFGNITKVSEVLTPIETVKASPSGRLSYEETVAYNAGQPVRKLSANARRIKANTKARQAKFKAEVIVPHAKSKGGCFWNSPECAGRKLGETGRKWHYSCEKGRKYAKEQLAAR